MLAEVQPTGFTFMLRKGSYYCIWDWREIPPRSDWWGPLFFSSSYGIWDCSLLEESYFIKLVLQVIPAPRWGLLSAFVLCGLIYWKYCMWRILASFGIHPHLSAQGLQGDYRTPFIKHHSDLIEEGLYDITSSNYLTLPSASSHHFPFCQKANFIFEGGLVSQETKSHFNCAATCIYQYAIESHTQISDSPEVAPIYSGRRLS